MGYLGGVVLGGEAEGDGLRADVGVEVAEEVEPAVVVIELRE